MDVFFRALGGARQKKEQQDEQAVNDQAAGIDRAFHQSEKPVAHTDFFQQFNLKAQQKHAAQHVKGSKKPLAAFHGYQGHGQPEQIDPLIKGWG